MDVAVILVYLTVFSVIAFSFQLSWELKIKKKLKTLPPCLGKFRPIVGQCCHQCTPDSLLGQNSSLGFQNLLSVNETNTRYRGWLVRRVCCALFVMGCKVYPSPASNRLERVCQSNRVKEVLTAENKVKGVYGQGQINRLSAFLPLINTCIVPGALRCMFSSMFDNIQVNLNHLAALHRASQEVQGSLLLYVHVRQSLVDCAVIALVLFSHNLRVPYTVCPLQTILQKVGVLLLPPSILTEQLAEMDSLHSPVITSLVRELLQEGQAMSVGISPESDQGGQWLAHITQLIKEGSVTDVILVPVGISYDCVPKTSIQVGLSSVLQWLWSFLWRNPRGCVRIHFALPFSLKEMCESERWRVNKWLPLQDLLLPVILNDRTDSVFGRRRMSWLLPCLHYASELIEPTHPQRDRSIAIILHLIFSTSNASLLCHDVAWLTEEVLLRNKDVGFGGSLVQIVHYSLSLLAPHLITAALKDPFIAPRPSLAATMHLSFQAQIVTHTFILEAVGACAVSAMLCEVASSGVSSRMRSGIVGEEEVKGDMEFDVVLCQSELTERALQLCHLLPPGFMPPCQSCQSFALDAVDSLIRCGILVMEEITRDVPICDLFKEGMLTWTASDDPYQSGSDCEEQELHSYKISQPSQCPEMLFFLCSMLAGHLRALCWTTSMLDLLPTPLPGMFTEYLKEGVLLVAESHLTALRFYLLQVLLEEHQKEGSVFLGVSPLFQLSENRQKLTRFISQYLYN
uniref:Uncharacterized protein n=1 Tax=Mola mola TaxID=94237 RepID=A0A3Q3WPL6_MOLML